MDGGHRFTRVKMRISNVRHRTSNFEVKRIKSVDHEMRMSGPGAFWVDAHMQLGGSLADDGEADRIAVGERDGEAEHIAVEAQGANYSTNSPKCVV